MYIYSWFSRDVTGLSKFGCPPYLCPSESVKFIICKPDLYLVFAFFGLFCEFNMDSSNENGKVEIEKLSRKIPVLSEYAESLENHIKLQYLQKISVVGVDLANIPCDQFSSECLPPIEQSDLFSCLVLQTSFYMNDQFKNFKSLEAYNQVVSGFVASVKGKMISGKCVVVAKVRHSQRMNDPLVNVWIIADTNRTVLSSHCLGCKAGLAVRLAESCSHVASAMIYIGCWARVNRKMACTQVKCAWLLPTYVNEVSYARVKDIDFSSAKKLKENLDTRIDSLDTTCHECQVEPPYACRKATTSIPSLPVPKSEMDIFYQALNHCETKASVLSLIDPYAEQFVAKSRNVPVLSDLFEPTNLELKYPELLQKCKDVKINVSDEEIKIVEQDTQDQARGPGFFRHRAGRIGASVNGAVYHSNVAQPSQSLISLSVIHTFLS